MPQISIENFQLSLKIGVTDEERQKPQHLYLNLKASMEAETTDQAANSDDIKDAMVDYDILLKTIKQVEEKEYHLIEKLAADIYQITLEFIADKRVKVGVEVQKYPEIKGLIGGVKYRYGNFFEF